MGKVQIADNYKAVKDGEEYTFYAVSDRQAWYSAYEWCDDELVDALYEIDSRGEVIRVLLEKEE